MTKCIGLIMIAMTTFGSAAIAQVPQVAPPGIEHLAGRYFVAPKPNDAPALPQYGQLENLGTVGLTARLNALDAATRKCVEMRENISALVQGDFGAYAVHPAWLTLYQDCLTKRRQEAAEMTPLLRARQSELMAGAASDDALRISDSIARLIVLRGEIEEKINAEIDRHEALLDVYNANGGPEIQASSQIE